MHTTTNGKPLRRTSRFYAFAIIASLLLFVSCAKRKPVDIDPAFSKYIEAYTSGVISKKAAIRIQLAVDAPVTHSLHETIEEELFSFSPAVEGKAYWVDARTIEFKPDKDLAPDELYEVSFKLGKVLTVPSAFKTFHFNVQPFKPALQVEESGLRSFGKDRMTLGGEVTTADVEASDAVEKTLTANLDGRQLAIKWQHNEVNRVHSYTIENITRTANAGKLLLSWNGEAIHADSKGEKEIDVPAIGDFKVLEVRVVQDAEQYVLVQFSDPIAANQTFDGLISVSNQENPSFTVLGNQVKVYSSNHYDGDYTVNVNEGITNQWGDKLDKAFTANVFFENRLPSVKIQGKGVLLPNSGGKVVLPFEAVNLKAVDIAIIKIFENNIPQYLQTNDLDNASAYIREVARPLVEATVKLDDDKTIDLHKKNRFLLDLDKYIKTEPGAIYRVRIAFRPAYSLQTCTETSPTKIARVDDEDDGDGYGSKNDEDDAFWMRYNQGFPYGYDWEQRNNPCNNAYYNKERFATRNILATNIGLSAKRGNDNSLMVIVNNLISTDPMSGVELQALDYQQQIVGKASSNSDGIAVITASRKPFLIIAKKGTEKSYLRVDDGGALPLSRFDVNGTEVKKGIKGFIFGERGVWRPGDSLFLSCIIEDKDHKLPADHPIELELLTPEGQLYKRIVSTNATDGLNVFKTATDPSAPTGNWLCRVKAGGAVFEKRVKIETVMPNRLKIDLNFGKDGVLGKHITGNGTLSAKWLFGAVAQNLKARVDVQLYRKQTSFPGFKDYVFDDPSSSFAPQSKTIFDGSLNAQGTASVNPSFDAGDKAPGMLLANLTVKVFEPGGSFSIDNIALPYHPYTSYAGIKSPAGNDQWGYLQSNKSHSFALADVNTDGSPVTGNSTLEVSLYKIQWRWWWDRSGDDLSNFTEDQYTKLIKKEKTTLANGKGSYNVKIDGYGRYMLLVKDTRSGHTAGKEFFVDNDDWQSRSDETSGGAVTMLSFSADKTNCNTGDKVNLSIPSSEGGRALISIETGTKVLKTYWVNTTKGQTKFSFTTDKTMSPNIYVNVSLIQPHAQTVNDLPIRMYGVLPIMVGDKNTILKPVIQMNESIRPEQNVSMTVSEKDHRSMSYVIAIVDEGLLDLTRFKTPDPHSNFYAKEALGVKSWDVYDYVIGAWGGELQRILTIGGDGEGDLSSKTRRANRFKPVVKFMGPFKSNGSSKTHNFTLPPYMGSVRAMVIAVKDGSYGMAEKSVKVKKPLMLIATLPRVLGPSEELRIPVTVFATESSVKNVNLSLQSNPFIEAAGNQNLSFNGTGEQVVYFNAKVKNKTGIGKIKVTASSGRETASYEMEIDIRNPNPVMTQVTEAVLQPGQNWSNSTVMIGEGQLSKATLEVSSIPAINLQKRLDYLIQYPHGCIEQTTSSVFPQLALYQLTDISDARKAEIDRNIRAAIQRIQNFQTSHGGFSYWPGDNNDDEWGTNYAGHFLLEASARGYNVPSSMLQQWRSYQRSKALAWNITVQPYYGDDLVQAYRLYLLALNKSPEIGAMNRLKEYKFITPECKWRLAAAYHLAGQTQVALQMISGLPTIFAEKPYWGISYGSNLRDEAMVLETLTVLNRRAEAAQLVKTIAANLAQDNWYSTQTTAYSLLAIAKYSGSIKDNVKINASGKAGGQNLSINSASSVSQTTIGWQNGKANVQLTNNGKNVLYVRVINEGQPISTEAVPPKNNPEILELSAVYMTTTGYPVDPAKIKQGTDFVAKITIRNPGRRGYYSEMALSQLFPAGWEILNTRLYNSEGGFKSSESQYMDIRDDRVYHYFTIKANESLTYYVQLNAAYLGKYFWPGVYCEAMYDHTISANVSGKWVEIVE